ncbi:hypothetical protein ENUP19_0278G0025 [Entamoeba nuttalli]|uniref:Uncharacterized protein n=1 Tax=Entamoeba nuttalli TaxID=412467 RepID=A0ABQ0DTL9_9EUKA
MDNTLEPRLALHPSVVNCLTPNQRNELLEQYNSDINQLYYAFPKLQHIDIEKTYQLCGRNLNNTVTELVKLQKEKDKEDEKKQQQENKELPKEENANVRNVGNGDRIKHQLPMYIFRPLIPLPRKEDEKKQQQENKELPKEENVNVHNVGNGDRIKYQPPMYILKPLIPLPRKEEENITKTEKEDDLEKTLPPSNMEEQEVILTASQEKEISNETEQKEIKELIQTELKYDVKININGNDCIITASFDRNERFKNNFLQIVDRYNENLVKDKREIGKSISFIWKLSLEDGEYELQYFDSEHSTSINLNQIDVNPVKMIVSKQSEELIVYLSQGPIDKVSWVGLYTVDGPIGRKYVHYQDTKGMVDNIIHIPLQPNDKGLFICRAFSNNNSVGGFLSSQYFTLGDSNQIEVE